MVIPNLNFGGAQRVFHQHALGLSSQFDVTECVFNRDVPVAFPTGLPLESLDVGGGRNVGEKAARFVQRIVRLRRLKARLRPDVSVSHLEGADYVNVLSRRGDKIILCVHGTKLHDENISGALGLARKRLMIPALYRQADHVVTVSRAIRTELIEAFGLPAERVTAIANGFELERIAQAMAEPIEPALAEVFSTHPVLVTSGRFAVQKNQAELVELFALLAQRVPRARLALVGDGELRGELTATAHRLGLSTCDVDRGQAPSAGQVLFLGQQSNPFRFVARGTVFVLTSGWEGFPMALGEAMACHVPVVTVDCPTGPRELLSEGDPHPLPLGQPEETAAGILMPRLDGGGGPRATWVKTLAALLDDGPRRTRLADGARARIQAFGLERILDEWRRLVASV